MKSKSVVITGASSGIGRQLARDLAALDARLVLAARDSEQLEALASELRGSGCQAVAQPTDVTDPEQCRRLIETAVSNFGGIDFLVLNAGISMWSSFEQITDLTIFKKLMETNYLGAVYCVHAALPHLVRAEGTIVAVTSTQAIIGLPNHTAYSASKQAVRGFLEALEFELNGAVRVLQVMPGWIKGTNLRDQAVRGDGQLVGSNKRSHGKEAVSVEDCSRQMVRAMQSRQTQLYIPAKLRFVPWLKLLAPRWLARKIRRAVKKQ